MQALQRAQQSRNKTSNSEQAIQRLHSHLAFAEWLYCRPTQNEDGDGTDEKLLVSAVLSAMLASPAFAQSYNAGYCTGNLINLPALEHGGPNASAGEAYASAPPRASARHLRHARTQETTSPNDPYAIYDESGQYVGRDPDPNVRFELRRDDAHDY
ncbi:MAG: hypothetical protein WA375_00520 [Pseudolabrys sp.]